MLFSPNSGFSHSASQSGGIYLLIRVCTPQHSTAGVSTSCLLYKFTSTTPHISRSPHTAAPDRTQHAPRHTNIHVEVKALPTQHSASTVFNDVRPPRDEGVSIVNEDRASPQAAASSYHQGVTHTHWLLTPPAHPLSALPSPPFPAPHRASASPPSLVSLLHVSCCCLTASLRSPRGGASTLTPALPALPAHYHNGYHGTQEGKVFMMLCQALYLS